MSKYIRLSKCFTERKAENNMADNNYLVKNLWNLKLKKKYFKIKDGKNKLTANSNISNNHLKINMNDIDNFIHTYCVNRELPTTINNFSTVNNNLSKKASQNNYINLKDNKSSLLNIRSSIKFKIKNSYKDISSTTKFDIKKIFPKYNYPTNKASEKKVPKIKNNIITKYLIKEKDNIRSIIKKIYN